MGTMPQEMLKEIVTSSSTISIAHMEPHNGSTEESLTDCKNSA